LAGCDRRPDQPFFVDFYRRVAQTAMGLEAREHTAQVPVDLRIDREQRFAEAKLPVLYCSPTMELGVDIRVR
jgi:Lhr-like helicase